MVFLKRKFIWILLFSTFALCLLVGAYLISEFDGMESMSSCEERQEAMVASPNAQWILGVNIKECGATTEFVTSIRLVNKTTFAENSKNDTQGKKILEIKGQHNIVAVWLDDNHVIVSGDNLSSRNFTYFGNGQDVDIKINSR